MLNPAVLVIWLAMSLLVLTQLAGIQIDARLECQLEILVSIPIPIYLSYWAVSIPRPFNQYHIMLLMGDVAKV